MITGLRAVVAFVVRALELGKLDSPKQCRIPHQHTRDEHHSRRRALTEHHIWLATHLLEHVQLVKHLSGRVCCKYRRAEAIEWEQQNSIPMAGTRVKGPPVGSSQWIQDERALVGEKIGEVTEDFEFSVRNELEWLNEHMKEIFSTNQV